jgi:hypothetical protein
MENEVVDTTAGTTVDTEQSTLQETTHEAPQQQEEKYSPFASGKEKFKINGVEEEWDWDTTKRYAQLGKAGQQAMQKAASLEKKQREIYTQMREAAMRDPDGFLEVITGQKRTAAPQDTQAQEIDPRDLELQTTRHELAQIKDRLEREDIEREKQAIEQELNAAIEKYPDFNSKLFKTFVRDEYRRALNNGLDVSLEDVAFLAAQDLRSETQEKQKRIETKLEENKKRSPVITPPPSSTSSGKGMTLEDVKRLAGRA